LTGSGKGKLPSSGKRRSEPAVDDTATLIRTVLPASRHTRGYSPRDHGPERPGGVANARGSEKMPASTIDPTTIAVSANRENFSERSDTAAGAAAPTSIIT
jgi:hypothetical protein